jgi:hypothetical protein
VHQVVVEAEGDALPGQAGAGRELLPGELDDAVTLDGAVGFDRGAGGQRRPAVAGGQGRGGRGRPGGPCAAHPQFLQVAGVEAGGDGLDVVAV